MRLQTKIVYGRPMFYPADETSKVLVEGLIQRRCLNEGLLAQLELLADLMGFKIEIIQPEAPMVKNPLARKA